MRKIISALLFIIMLLNVFACAKTNVEETETKVNESILIEETTTEKKQYEEIKIGDSVARINLDTFVLETVVEENETKETLDNTITDIFRAEITNKQ